MEEKKKWPKTLGVKVEGIEEAKEFLELLKEIKGEARQVVEVLKEFEEIISALSLRKD